MGGSRVTERLDYTKAAPEGMKSLAAVHAYVGHSGFPKSFIDLVYLRVSQINGCAYCIDMHARDLIDAGMSRDKVILVQVWRESGSLFSEREQAALAWAETVTLVAQTHIPEADFTAAAVHFSEKELADLTIAIGLMNAYNRIAIGFRTTPASAKI
jgi:AhpD family alkylhydroperoxidase